MRTTLSLAYFLIPLLSTTLWAAVPTEFEPDYAEAILAFHDRNYPEVIRILSPMLEKETRSEELLEIAALTYKYLGQEKKTEKLYGEILQLLRTRNVSPLDLIPYEFELAVIQYRNKKWTEAERMFKRAIALQFNEIPSWFFLGIIAMDKRDWATAEASFTTVSQSPNLELALSSRLYLAQVYANQNSQARMVNEYVMAYDQARGELKKKELKEEDKTMLGKVLKVAEKALKPLKKHTVFGGIGLVSSYDTNVFSDATDTSASGGTKKASLKESLQASLGYASPLVDEWQFVLSYRGNGNKNFNAETLDAQFLQNDLALNLTHAPLESSYLGLKVGTAYLFQYVSASGNWEPYELQLIAGPYWRTQFSNGWAIGGQANLNRRSLYQDSALDAIYHRSANEIEIKLNTQQDNHAKFFNPTLELTGMLRPTEGTEYRSKFVQLELSNNSYLTSGIQILLSASGGKTIYDAREDGTRSDMTLTGRFALSIRLLKSLQWVNDVQVIKNSSNVALYDYARNVFSSGITASF